MNNKGVRKSIEQSGLKYWEVAHEIGITDATFSRWLRLPLEGEKKARVVSAISELQKQPN